MTLGRRIHELEADKAIHNEGDAISIFKTIYEDDGTEAVQCVLVRGANEVFGPEGSEMLMWEAVNACHLRTHGRPLSGFSRQQTEQGVQP